jgi:exo-beta-1,3-glucanase (GH17 family)
MANIHPFFSGIDVNGAANWTLQFLTNNVVSTTTNLSPKPSIIISEGKLVSPSSLIRSVGWPTGSGSINSSVAGVDEMQYFINTFPAAAHEAGVDYYWFEGYDEPWKIVYDTATDQYEDHWVFFFLVSELISGSIGCKWVFKRRNNIADLCLIDT